MDEEEQSQSRPLESLPSSSDEPALPISPSLTSSHLYQQSETPPTTEVQLHVPPPEGDTADDHQQQQHRRRLGGRSRSHRVNFPVPDSSFGDIRDDAWYCLAVIVTFWFFASMTVILGFYGSETLKLGPNCSQLFTENELFVQSIQAQQIEGIPGPMLYGFHTMPTLDVETRWTDTHDASVQPNFHKEWVYNLNAGSKLDISYDVKNPSSSPLSLVIAQGEESFLEWIEYPLYPNTTLSWNIIHGSGRIEQGITNSDTYYIAVGNLNPEVLEVQLNVTVTALLYNTTQAYFRCSLHNRLCSFSLMFLKKNAVVLTAPGPEQVKNDDGWYVTLSYGPRWLTFILCLGILAIVTLLMFRFWNMFQRIHGDGIGSQSGIEADDQEPLLSPKDDDLSSLGSSYDSVSNDEEDLDEWLPVEGKQLKEGENTTSYRKLCVICFDSPRDCFFLPCGHCAACFACGSRIAEEAGTCPICRRRMKKVRKIYSV